MNDIKEKLTYLILKSRDYSAAIRDSQEELESAIEQINALASDILSRKCSSCESLREEIEAMKSEMSEWLLKYR